MGRDYHTPLPRFKLRSPTEIFSLKRKKGFEALLFPRSLLDLSLRLRYTSLS